MILFPVEFFAKRAREPLNIFSCLIWKIIGVKFEKPYASVAIFFPRPTTMLIVVAESVQIRYRELFYKNNQAGAIWKFVSLHLFDTYARSSIGIAMEVPSIPDTILPSNLFCTATGLTERR